MSDKKAAPHEASANEPVKLQWVPFVPDMEVARAAAEATNELLAKLRNEKAEQTQPSDRNMEYRVGQVLFIIPADTTSVVPVLIMERRISETVDGTIVKHIIKSPKPKAQPMVLETVKGLVFADLRVAREAMVKKAIDAIDSMIKHAHGIAIQAFDPRQSLPTTVQQVDDPFDTTGLLAIGDQSPDRTIENSFDHGQNLDMDESGMTEIMLPNGQRQRVKVKTS